MTDKEFLVKNQDLFQRMNDYYPRKGYGIHHFEVYKDGLIVVFGRQSPFSGAHNIWRVGQPGYHIVYSVKEAKKAIDEERRCVSSG